MSEVTTHTRPITIAILAMGGQGGGVLSDWIVNLAEHSGYLAQTTSVPGVAQRTGATIYYLELFPAEAAQIAGRDPVLALMPVPGDVDILIAAEFMEVGRALQRGLITADRTTVIASSHRVYGITEKTAMGNGIHDPEPIRKNATIAAKRFIHFDMNATAEANGSVISAVLFGALAASTALPLSREAYEAAIRRGGVGVEPSLKAFSAGMEQAIAEPVTAVPDDPLANQTTNARVLELLDRIQTRHPEQVRRNAQEGIRRMMDYQDTEYAEHYLERLERIIDLEHANGGASHDYQLSAETARYLALWMSYEDTIRVADLKTRSERFKRVREEVKVKNDQITYVTEFMHPRVEEICDTLPSGVGNWIMRSPRVCRLLGRLTHRGRHIRTTKLTGFFMLYTLAGMRRWRRKTLRFTVEDKRINAWLERVEKLIPDDPKLAIEVIECQRLVKGYGDTHARGWRSFDTIMRVLDRHSDRPDLPAQVRRLRDAGLEDEDGKSLELLVNELDQFPDRAPVLASSRD
ncbi:indolepyruvate oxidoreductase subunit beta family protein [Saccharospirillum sp.]|uniref:indolepyruvate oxidoreductase subunit beta family protein n=1 Tax=Saccharospirillum sp. TaxID=2033801 RepID=UPI0034A0267C